MAHIWRTSIPEPAQPRRRRRCRLRRSRRQSRRNPGRERTPGYAEWPCRVCVPCLPGPGEPVASWWPPRGPRALYSRLLSTAWDEPEGSGNRHHGGGGQQREQGQPHQRQACAPGPGASADALPVMLVHESPLQDARAARARFRPGTPPSVPGRKGTRCRARFAPILRPIYAWLTFIVRLSQQSDMKVRPASHPRFYGA